MKFDALTLQIMKNFSTINPAIGIHAGDKLSTVNSSKTVMALAKVPLQFPQPFAISDISKFISVLSLFEDPEIEFNEKNLTIRKDKAKVVYGVAESSMILYGPQKAIKFPSEEVVVPITEKQLQSAQRAMSVLQLPELGIIGDGDTIRLVALNAVSQGKENRVSDSFSLDLGPTDKTFSFIFNRDNLVMLPRDYTLTISKSGLTRFECPDLIYWVALELKSSYEGKPIAMTGSK